MPWKIHSIYVREARSNAATKGYLPVSNIPTTTEKAAVPCWSQSRASLSAAEALAVIRSADRQQIQHRRQLEQLQTKFDKLPEHERAAFEAVGFAGEAYTSILD